MKTKTIVYALIGLILAYAVAAYVSQGEDVCYKSETLTCGCVNGSVQCHETAPTPTLPEETAVQFAYILPIEAEELCKC